MPGTTTIAMKSTVLSSNVITKHPRAKDVLNIYIATEVPLSVALKTPFPPISILSSTQ